MASTVAGEIVRFHDFLFINLTDPRTVDYPLMGLPWPGLSIVIAYLYFVVILGPKLMENRSPLKLDRLVMALDIFQIISNTIIFLSTVWVFSRDPSTIWCLEYKWDNSPQAVLEYRIFYAYFASKMADFLDTICMVLRKNDRQISFLHLYHHVGIMMLAWGGTKYFPGGSATIVVSLNTFVHAVMYSYYLLSLLQYKWVLRWKKMITLLQMAQFLFLLVHGIQLFLFQTCSYPIKLYCALFLPQLAVMLWMFYNFYVQTYGKQESQSAASDSKSRHESKAAKETEKID